jgi:hypothetical protein
MSDQQQRQQSEQQQQQLQPPQTTLDQNIFFMEQQRAAQELEHQENQLVGDEGATIVRNIASFLTFSDVGSIASASASGLDIDAAPSIEDSWNNLGSPVPVGNLPRWTSIHSLETPETPALIAVSPDPDKDFDKEEEEDDDSYNSFEEQMKRSKKRQWAQKKLAAAVFSHPRSLRTYSVDAYLAAKAVQEEQMAKRNEEIPPETLIEPASSRKRRRRHQDKRSETIQALVHHILGNVPLSVVLDILETYKEITLDTTFAVVTLSGRTISGLINRLFRLIGAIWDGIISFNPVELVQAIILHPFNAMGKTTEVVVSGIQSVATGVGSASSLALHRLSSKANIGSSSSSLYGTQSALRRSRPSLNNVLNQKLLKKLSTINSAASVIKYEEKADDTGGLSRHAKSRVQRMMHYDVSLRPFIATVKVPEEEVSRLGYPKEDKEDGSPSSSASSPLESPFMCTPQSFPPTPSSRRMVLARGSRFADDVIFLARDQLRVHDALDSENERTREMAKALRQGKRLAVFDADDASAGIDLTCGQHCATKVGNMLYCSTRSMVPVLRNCYVYFEVTVMPRPGNDLIPQASMATLSIGLSTKEMPPNTLVGAWKGSTGLCTTGQILTAGQWCSPADPTTSSYGDRATVGCLVCLDDSSGFETWDGVMVTASITFNVNQVIVSPPVSTLPMGASGMMSPPPQQPPSPSIQGTSHPPITLPLLVPAEEELYPTVTLHSPATAVMCRFSSGDVLANTRSAIGAPEGVTVYSVDGSVIFDKNT